MKKTCIIFILICFFSMLGGCADSAAERNVMLLSDYDSLMFKETTQMVQNSYEQFVDDTINSDKTMIIGNEIYNLRYKDSITHYGVKLDTFTTVDGKLACKYDNLGKLRQISIEDFSAFPTFASEENYIDWCKSYMSTLGFPVPEQYVYTCETSVFVKGDEYAYNDVKDSFVAPTENTVKYRFAFTRYEGSIPTTDRIEIYLNLKFKNLIVKLDAEQFADGISTEIRLSDVNSGVQKFIKSSIISNYSLKSCDIVNQRLTYIDNRLCIISTVNITVSTDIKDLVEVVSYLT